LRQVTDDDVSSGAFDADLADCEAGDCGDMPKKRERENHGNSGRGENYSSPTCITSSEISPSHAFSGDFNFGGDAHQTPVAAPPVHSRGHKKAAIDHHAQGSSEIVSARSNNSTPSAKKRPKLSLSTAPPCDIKGEREAVDVLMNMLSPQNSSRSQMSPKFFSTSDSSAIDDIILANNLANSMQNTFFGAPMVIPSSIDRFNSICSTMSTPGFHVEEMMGMDTDLEGRMSVLTPVVKSNGFFGQPFDAFQGTGFDMWSTSPIHQAFGANPIKSTRKGKRSNPKNNKSFTFVPTLQLSPFVPVDESVVESITGLVSLRESFENGDYKPVSARLPASSPLVDPSMGRCRSLSALADLATKNATNLRVDAVPYDRSLAQNKTNNIISPISAGDGVDADCKEDDMVVGAEMI
jgi:hypothetical protein